MRLFHRERVSIGNTILRRHMTPQQKDRLATVNALFSGIQLTSDMPTRYTPVQRQRYTALRDLAITQKNIRVDADKGLTISYTLHGEEHSLKLK